MAETVDIDQLKIRLLIICKAKAKFESVANYLVRRGWETTISANIKDSFKTIAVFKPDFVLVSVNLPTPKINLLPSVIAQTFKVQTILFSESTDAKSLRLMQTVEASYKMTGTVSGPSAHRRIKQILQEIHQPASQTNQQNAGKANSEEDGSIVIKGVSNLNKNETIIQKGVAGFSDDRGHPTSQRTASGVNNEAGGLNDVDAIAAQFQEELKDETGDSVSEETLPEKSESELAEIEVNDGNNSSTKIEPPQGSTKMNSGTNRNLDDGVSPNLKATRESENTSSQLNGAINQLSDQARTEDATQSGDLDKVSKETSKSSIEKKELKSGKQGEIPKDLIEIVSTVAKKCLLPERGCSAKVDAYSECTILPIYAANLKIYLALIGLGPIDEELQFSTSFWPELKERLFAEYKSISVGDEARIEFGALSIHDRISGEANNLILRNGTGEILIKFIEESPIEAQVIKSNNQESAQISINDLVTNAAVGADIFLRLERNDKYYLYLKPRSRISEKQKTRLIACGSKLYIKTTDVDGYRRAVKRNKTFEAFFDSSKRSKPAA